MAKHKSPKSLKTVPAVIKALGGPSAIAEWTGMGTTAVGRWNDWGFIPPAWYYEIVTRLAEQGYGVDPTVFGFKKAASPRHNGEARHVA
jgi:hypothetical protein